MRSQLLLLVITYLLVFKPCVSILSQHSLILDISEGKVIRPGCERVFVDEFIGFNISSLEVLHAQVFFSLMLIVSVVIDFVVSFILVVVLSFPNLVGRLFSCNHVHGVQFLNDVG